LQEAQLLETFDRIVADFGRFDGIVNNAAPARRPAGQGEGKARSLAR